jgi:hypothetical protein
MLPLHPHAPVGSWRLRPRAGEPASLIELVVQMLFRWRIEAVTVYIITATILTLLFYAGLL